MANVRVGLSLTSSDVLSSNLNLSVATSLLVDSGSLIRAKVKGTVADTNDLCIYIVDQCSDRAYLYIKNLDSQLENYVDTQIEYGVFGNDNSAAPYGGT